MGYRYKYDANNIYFAANYAETLNMTTMAMVISLTKHKVLKWWRNIIRLRLAPITRLPEIERQRSGRYGDQDMIEYIDVGATYFFKKICRPMLIIKST